MSVDHQPPFTAGTPCPRCGKTLASPDAVHYVTIQKPAYSPLLGAHVVEARRRCVR